MFEISPKNIAFIKDIRGFSRNTMHFEYMENNQMKTVHWKKLVGIYQKFNLDGNYHGIYFIFSCCFWERLI